MPSFGQQPDETDTRALLSDLLDPPDTLPR
jgi:hypothetical protein